MLRPVEMQSATQLLSTTKILNNMIITKETKKRFVKMLKGKQIIVICNKNTKRTNYDFLFIGAESRGRWDFNPMIHELTDFKLNPSCGSIRATDSVDVICRVLDKLREEKIFKSKECGYALYEKVRDLLCTFYL